MEKIHADAAAKQKAYRERLQARRRAGSAGFTDSELGRAARSLHISLQMDAQEGSSRAALLLGASPLETLRNIQADIAPDPPVKWKRTADRTQQEGSGRPSVTRREGIEDGGDFYK